MTRRIFVLVALALGWIYGRADAVEPLPANHYPATVICPAMAEDAAAHLRLVRYEAGGSVLVYRCERKGY